MLLGAACGGAALAVTPPAYAQAENQAAARALFEEARDLAKAGNYSAACPKFEAANRLYTSPGALLNLADCYEHLGRTASAWSQFGEAASVADRADRGDVAEEARKRQRALEPKLMRLEIRVSHLVEGLVVERDGAPIAEAAWGASLPVDPGKHRLEARARGHLPWSQDIELSKLGETVTIDVPALEVDPAAQSNAESPGPGTSSGAGADPALDSAPARSHTLQWVLIGGGAAVAIGGTVLMLVQSGRASDAREKNDTDMYDSTKTPWAIGLTGALLGTAAAGAGGIWLLSEPAQEGAGVQGGPWLSATGGGVTVRGNW